MSLNYFVLIEVDFVDDLSDEDLAIVRWHSGRDEEEPLGAAGGPFVAPANLHSDIDLGQLPGGVTSQLVQVRDPWEPAGPPHWSLALRARMKDDCLEWALPTINWLGCRSRTDGFFASLRSQYTPSAEISFAAYGGWTYSIVDGLPAGLDPSGPPPPEALLQACST